MNHSLLFNSTKSLYLQIKEKIVEQILKGELKPGEKIPSERELCELYGVSRITVRQALKEATEDGFLFSVQGKGTFVEDKDEVKIGQSLDEFTEFKRTLTNKGLTAGTQIFQSKVLLSDFALGRILALDISEQILNISLLGTADDQPIVYYNSYFELELGQRLLEEAMKKEKTGEAFSTYDLYRELGDVLPNYAEQTFEALGADDQLAEILQIELGTPLFLVTSIFYDQESTPVEYKKAYYLANRYKFHIKRKIAY